MDPELLAYRSGGFFVGSPAAIPERIVGTPEAVRRAEGCRRVLGLWLHPADAELLLEEEVPLPPARRPAVQRLLQRFLVLGELLPQAPQVLGFQVLGFEGERAWTWAEAGLVRRASADLGAVADACGLIGDRGAAASVVQLLNCEDLGPPVIWRPWLLTAHRPPGGV